MKKKHLFVLIMFLAFCLNANAIIATGQQVDASVVAIDNDAVTYFELFRKRLLNDDVEGLSELILFPVEGDYSWEQPDETGEIKRHFNPYRTKADFAQNYSKLFGKEVLNYFLHDSVNVAGRKLVEAMATLDIANLLREGTHIVVRIEPNIEFYFSLYNNDAEQIHFSLRYKETDCDVCESGIIYRFQKTNGNMRLVAIQFVG